VFLVAAPLALIGVLVVTLLREQPLRGRESVQPAAAKPGEGAPQAERIAA
jgi:hypothetical protein